MIDKTCPLGHTCEKCLWNVHIRGIDPTTNTEVDQEKCAIAWLPVLLIENSQQQRSTGHAVESFRNEMVNSNEVVAQIMIESLNRSSSSQQSNDHPKLIGTNDNS